MKTYLVSLVVLLSGHSIDRRITVEALDAEHACEVAEQEMAKAGFVESTATHARLLRPGEFVPEPEECEAIEV